MGDQGLRSLGVRLSKRRGALDWRAFPATGEGTTAEDALLTLVGGSVLTCI
jgi:hypothetical protein